MKLIRFFFLFLYNLKKKKNTAEPYIIYICAHENEQCRKQHEILNTVVFFTNDTLLLINVSKFSKKQFQVVIIDTAKIYLIHLNMERIITILLYTGVQGSDNDHPVSVQKPK